MNAVTKALLALFLSSGLAAVALVMFMETVRESGSGWVAALCVAAYLGCIRLIWLSAQAWRRAKGWQQ